MSKHLLLVHGNGGANTRFQLMLEHARQDQLPDFKIHLPLLPGFEGRPLKKAANAWDPFIEALAAVIMEAPDEEWILYGHGIGGSFLLEWAARDWQLPNGASFQPTQVIMHSIIGASLQERWFPKVMKFKPLRSLIHWMIYQPWMRARWEQKLFLNPEAIPVVLRDRFFADYEQCEAFPLLFDLITPNWYKQVQLGTGEKPFYFLWGAKERVVAANYLKYWQRDYPNAKFETVPSWDHFPMLEQAEDFYKKIKQIIFSE